MSNLLKHHQAREWADRMRPLDDKRFLNNCFGTGLYSKIVKGQYSLTIQSLELSKDETFFITGGDHERKECVLMWSMDNVFTRVDQTELKPTVILNARYDTDDSENCVLCVAISPDDCRVLSGGWSKRVLIYDIQRYTYQLNYSFISYSNNVDLYKKSSAA
jgi:WD40 repeat protein